jgi:restriction system protein
MSAQPQRPRALQVSAPGRLRTVTPEAFKNWVGGRFTGLGYVVRLTPFRGDHGVDLIAARQDERPIVQCKHRPNRSVGEPVLRDLYGTLHHSAAQHAYLVTTGSATPAAREWANDKPIDVWDWQYLVEHWPTEITELAAPYPAAPAEVRPG